jgi:hypothetical protein
MLERTSLARKISKPAANRRTPFQKGGFGSFVWFATNAANKVRQSSWFAKKSSLGRTDLATPVQSTEQEAVARGNRSKFQKIRRSRAQGRRERDRLRIVMSSVMRRRRGLIAAIGERKG